MKRVGILALQGDFQAHAAAIRAAGAEAVEVRRVAELDEVAGLVMPGGESTTLLNLMGDEPWFDALRAFHAAGGPIFGTCAGAILLAREVRDPAQPSLGLLDVTIRRNAYGRQVDSFEADLPIVGQSVPFRAVFIRAPEFLRVGPSVEVLASSGDTPVLVRQGHVLAATFHPELTADPRIHSEFLTLLAERVKPENPRREIPAGPAPGLAVESRRVPC